MNTFINLFSSEINEVPNYIVDALWSELRESFTVSFK